MALPVEWPSVLPAPKLGAQFACADSQHHGTGDFAPQSVVLDANYCETLSATFAMDCHQYELFRSWYRWRLCNGVGWCRVSWAGRVGMARFSEGWSAQRISADRYDLTATLEIDYSWPG